MSPAEVLEHALADGLRVTVTSARTVRLRGLADTLNRWSPPLRAIRPAVLELLEIPARLAADLGDVDLVELEVLVQTGGPQLVNGNAREANYGHA